MAVKIGSTSTLGIQRQLGKHAEQAATALTRLSSGMRINRAADDAAGLAVSMSLSTDSRVLSQGVRNLNDGISRLSIAHGAVQGIKGVLGRMQELATQAATESISQTQRRSLNQEYLALASEYNRIVETTEMNGEQLFASQQLSASLQAGYSSLAVYTAAEGVIGTGSFSARQTIALPTDGALRSIKDLNGDGRLDLLGFIDNGTHLFTALANSNGSFAAVRTFQVSTQTLLGLTSADYNNDGVADYVFSTQGGVTAVGLGNGNATFAAPRTYANSLANSYLTGSVDLDYDGNQDLLIQETDGATTSALVVRLGQGDGTFSSARSLALSLPIFFTSAAQDFTEDDYRDILETKHTQANSSAVFIYRSNGDGTFGARTTISFGSNYRQASAADYNNDGILDLIASKADNTGFMVRLGNGNLSFAASSTFSTATTGTFSNIDINLDGNRDLLINSSGSLLLARGNGNGTFGAAQATGLSNIVGVSSTDLDLDGVADLVGTTTGDELVIAYGATSQSLTGTALRRFGHTWSGTPDITPGVRTAAEAREQLTYLANLFEDVTQIGAAIGASESRVSSALAALSATQLGYAEATNRILDADVAEESSTLLRAQILQQAASAVLAQSNQSNQIVLQLLR
jgi:flagellin